MQRRSIAILVAAVALVTAAVAGPTLAAPDASRATLATAHQTAVAKKKATTVKVKMREFKFTLSKKSVKKGKVTFKLKNVGKLPHDFKIAGKKSKLIAPGKSGTLKVKFKKKGKYTYICTVPGHAAAGMKGKLKVH